MGIYLSYLAFLLICIVTASNHEGCPSGFHTKNSTLFGSKTGYENVAYLHDDTLAPQGCSVKSIWMLIRHGARNPGDDLIVSMQTRLKELRNEIVKNGDEGKGTLCSGGLEALKNWNFHLTKSQENLLVPSGRAEQTALGGRWRHRLGDDWTSPFHSEDYLIRSTPTQRTEESAKGFMQGFFHGGNYKNVKLHVVGKGDPVLKPYKTCERFIENVKENPETMKEREKYFDGDEMNQVLEVVKGRTGVDHLKMEDIELMYEMLRHEEAWMEGTTDFSPWRSMFSEEDIAVIRYLDDLKYYYRDGYWNELSSKIACETVADMMKSLNEHAAGKNSPKGVFSFSHSGIIWKLFSRLGLFKPSIAPNSTNYRMNEPRIWNTGRLDPFSSNFAAVLFSCPSDPDPYKVQMFVQEKPVASSECGKSMCPLKTFREFVSRDYECDLGMFCGSGSGQSHTSLLSRYLIMGSVFVCLNLYLTA